MKKYAARTDLKARARALLLGHYLPLSGAFLSLALMEYIVVAPSSLIQIAPPFGTILYYGISFAIGLLFAVFKVGIAYLFLSNACGQPVYAGGIFTGFWHSPGKAMQIQLAPSLLLLVPNLLMDIFMMQYFITADRQWLLFCLAAGLVSLPYVLFIKILYSQVFFIMLDFPDMTALECLRYSRKLMRGSKGRYLLLMLSFMPLTLLGILTCGIGLLYVYPYREQTYANFYLDLIANTDKSSR